MSFDADDVRAAEELNRLWDARNLGSPAATSDSDRALIDQLLACDNSPTPDEAYVRQVRSSLMAAQTPVSPHIIGIVRPLPSPWPLVSGRRIAIAAALAACLTFLVFGGGGFLSDQANAPTVASVLASPASTPTAGPTTTVWMASPASFMFDRQVNLAAEIAATAVGDERSLVPPSTSLTVIDTSHDGTGRVWWFVKTSDGRVGWLPGDVSPLVAQEQS